jgi:hypothetical protein
MAWNVWKIWMPTGGTEFDARSILESVDHHKVLERRSSIPHPPLKFIELAAIPEGLYFIPSLGILAQGWLNGLFGYSKTMYRVQEQPFIDQFSERRR